MAAQGADDNKKNLPFYRRCGFFLWPLAKLGTTGGVVVVLLMALAMVTMLVLFRGGVGGPPIPECPGSPWKPQENLMGTCPGIQTPPHATEITTAQDCAQSCCDRPECITWQFRRDTGCLQKGDVRIAMEKDGPSAYCSHFAPIQWQGQFVKDRKSEECSVQTWHPDEEKGQCFGLGDVRPGLDTAEACMTACCQDEECGAWQFHKSLGCFYHRSMHACQPSHDPVVFEPFVGRRKFQPERTYSP